MRFSQVSSLFIAVFISAMATLIFAETANQTCHLLFVDLQKPNGNCEKPVDPPTPPSLELIDLSDTDSLPKYGTIRVSWMHRPPFASKPQKEGTRPTGIFIDLLHSSLSACFRLEGRDPPNITYDALPARSIESLHVKMYNQESDIILPVVYDLGQYSRTGYRDFMVLISPVDALLINKSLQYKQDQNQAWKSLLQILPILLSAILLAAIAGICIWALDTKWNSRDFPRPFTQGASEGFWWAFVTMTTVGYGDRTPKSLVGRIFGIFWIVASLAICSIMTASITAVLTSISVDKDVDIIDKDIAVLKGSGAIQNAVLNDANPKLFNDFDSMYVAMNKGQVDGILMEMYEASYRMREKADDNLKLGKIYKTFNSIGFVLSKSDALPFPIQECVEMLYMHRKTDVLLTINKFSQEVKKKARSQKSKEHEVVSLMTFDSPVLLIIIGVFLLLSLCGAIDQVCSLARGQAKTKSKEVEFNETKNVEPESIEIKNHVPVSKS